MFLSLRSFVPSTALRAQGVLRHLPRLSWRGSAGQVWAALAVLGLALLAAMANPTLAAGTGGTALQSAYTAVNDMINGYGKQLLTVIGFGVAAIGYMAANSTGVVMKFIGFAVFLSVGLAAAVGLVGALV